MKLSQQLWVVDGYWWLRGLFCLQNCLNIYTNGFVVCSVCNTVSTFIQMASWLVVFAKMSQQLHKWLRSSVCNTVSTFTHMALWFVLFATLSQNVHKWFHVSVCNTVSTFSQMASWFVCLQHCLNIYTKDREKSREPLSCQSTRNGNPIRPPEWEGHTF